MSAEEIQGRQLVTPARNGSAADMALVAVPDTDSSPWPEGMEPPVVFESLALAATAQSVSGHVQTLHVARAERPVAPEKNNECGLVFPPCKCPHQFNGHEDTWLHHEALKTELGYAPKPTARPVLLNCLAYKCRCKPVCALQLDESNVEALRTNFLVQLEKGQCDRTEAIKYTLSDLVTANETFSKKKCRVISRRGEWMDVELCPEAWAIIVAGIGYSTWTKWRTEVLKAVRLSHGSTVATLSFESSSSSSRQIVAERKKNPEGEVMRLLNAYVRQLCKTLEHSPVPGAQRTIEYHAPRETWSYGGTLARISTVARTLTCSGLGGPRLPFVEPGFRTISWWTKR